MIGTRARLTAMIAVLASSTAYGVAHATCTQQLAGTWYIFSMSVESPAIQTQTQRIKDPDSGIIKGITIFKDVPPGAGGPFNNRIAHVAKCQVDVKITGQATGSCLEITVDGAMQMAAEPGSNTRSRSDPDRAGPDPRAKLTLHSCDLTGKVAISDIPFLLVLNGHFDGNIGAGIGTVGPQVLQFVMVKK